MENKGVLVTGTYRDYNIAEPLHHLTGAPVHERDPSVIDRFVKSVLLDEPR